jgi:hypothetical protein
VLGEIVDYFSAVDAKDNVVVVGTDLPAVVTTIIVVVVFTVVT